MDARKAGTDNDKSSGSYFERTASTERNRTIRGRGGDAGAG